MGKICAACIITSIIIICTKMCLILSFDFWTAVHIGFICSATFGIFVGIVGAYKLRSKITNASLDDESFIKMLVKDINSTHNSIKIVEGKENINLYDDLRVKEAFEKAYRRGVKIQFVLKPVMAISKDA